jgi:hypothetical protein
MNGKTNKASSVKLPRTFTMVFILSGQPIIRPSQLEQQQYQPGIKFTQYPDLELTSNKKGQVDQGAYRRLKNY